MTREHHKSKLWASGNINTLSKVECNTLIDDIYDDFESRICENCVHYDKDIHGVQGWNNCLHLYQVTKPCFGCNNFERKIVDMI